ncbi:MAG: crossover junction endodeoxyribonuclease RuvC [Phycisphaerae bacterium]|jgi:crossover junction endodeoxyribonuclease RuvC|nr:crossover junction endodeoxyribonuclease RuvC [Phycisphaerae bacterium]
MTTSQRYRVLGVDPGLNITGYGIVDFLGGTRGPAIVEGGAIRTDAKSDISRRIEQIHSELTALLDEFHPDLVAIENLYAHYAHPRTSILMAHARGVILLAAQQAGVAVRGLAATKVKKSLTGNGHASKQQMQRAIQAVCRLDALPEPPDVADALAIALCAGRQR